MSEVLIIQLGQLTDAVVSTSIVKKLLTDGHRIHCVADPITRDLIGYCKNVRVESPEEATIESYDMAINLSPLVTCTEMIDKVDAATKLGYGRQGESLSFYNKGAELHYKHRYIGIPTPANLFQLTFGLAGMTWHGEGYHIGYFPRNRSKKGSIGIVIRDQLLRDYVKKNVNCDKTRISVVPFRQSVLKQIDEINRCKNIVTDEVGILHLALALRKNVELIVRKKPPFEIEMFNCGNIHVFDSTQLKEIA